MITDTLQSKIFSLNTFLLFSILTSFLILTSFYSLYTPALEGPDEEAHLEYSDMVAHGGNNGYTIEQPLYYMINGFFIQHIPHQNIVELPMNGNFNFGGNGDPHRFVHGTEEIFPFTGIAKIVHLLRIFSIGCGVVTLIFAYKTARLVFKENKWLPLFSTSFLMLIPKFVFINSVLNADVLVWSFSIISTYFLFRFVTNTNDSKSLILCGIFSGLASISKMNGIILLPVVFVTLTYLLFSKKVNRKEFTKKLTLYIFIFLISGGSYFFYQFTHTPSAFQPGSTLGGLSLNQSWYCITNFGNLDFRMFTTVWGYLGWQVFAPSSWELIAAHLMTTVAIVGLFLVFVKKMRLSDVSFMGGYPVILFTSAFFAILSMLYFMYNICYGDARYTFTAISSMVILMTIGFYAMFDKKFLKLLMILPIIFVLFLNLHALTEMDSDYDHGVFSILPSNVRYAASSEYVPSTIVKNAFDSNLGTVWHSSLTMPQWIQIDYRKPIVNTHLEIVAGNLWHPKDFEIQGYDDISKVTVLKKITDECCWTGHSIHDYSFENSNPYRFYRIYVIDGQGPTQAVEFAEVRFS